jgi:Tol biopolymer transport system component
MTIYRSNYIALAILLLVAAGACTDAVGPPEEEPLDQILFLRGDAQGPLALKDIYRINADGSGLENLTRHPAQYQQLDVTPDGRTIIFAEGGSCRIFTMAIDGSQLTNVTPVSCGFVPRLSPDGTKFAYERDWGIWVSNLDGTGAREVSYALPPVQSSCTSPVGRPNWTVRPLGWHSSSRLMFYRHICLVGQTDYSVDFEGGGLVELDFNAQSAYLSPDRTRIAFVHGETANSSSGVSIMNEYGAGVSVVAEGATLPGRFSQERSPWAPNGARIYFTTTEGHYVSDVDGSNVQRLPDVPLQAVFSGWSPRGDRIAFMVYTPMSSSIYLSDVIGMTNLTNSAVYDSDAVWVPRR